MPSSYIYWNTADVVSVELSALAQAGKEVYAALESDDDPGVLADGLADIKSRLDKLSTQIGSNIAPLRKAAKALSEIPGVQV